MRLDEFLTEIDVGYVVPVIVGAIVLAVVAFAVAIWAALR